MKHETVIRTRAKLAAALPSTTEILRGSLLRRRIRHRSGCAVCARGKGHLVWVLTVRDPGRRRRSEGGCAGCARGKGHLVWVLTVSDPGGRNKQISLSKEQKPRRRVKPFRPPLTLGEVSPIPAVHAVFRLFRPLLRQSMSTKTEPLPGTASGCHRCG